MAQDKKQRLVNEVESLKKAWILLMAVHGIPKGGKGMESELEIPNYAVLENRFLKRHIDDLESDIRSLAERLLLQKRLPPMGKRWCAQKFEDWRREGTPIFVLGTVHEIEAALGPLAHRNRVECPPYAQVLLQGFNSAAIRHPEYHLARDVALLWNLFVEEHDGCIESVKRGVPVHTENLQSLGRSAMIACFNLLESFVSGLATEWRMLNPLAAGISKLPDDMSSLRKRFFAVPAAILGNANLLDPSKPPFAELFDDLKKRRDAFVHCEPGPRVTKFGYVKEKHFHDIDREIVEKTVKLTLTAIRCVWNSIHRREGPRWLPSLDSSGRFPNVADIFLRLNEKEVSAKTKKESVC